MYHTEKGRDKFRVLVEARDYVAYVLQITRNEKVFLPEYRQDLTARIINAAYDIFMHAYRANAKRLDNDAERAMRNTLQDQALDACETMLALIDIAIPVYHLPGKRVSYWGRRTLLVRDLLREWMHFTKRFGEPSRKEVVKVEINQGKGQPDRAGR